MSLSQNSEWCLTNKSYYHLYNSTHLFAIKVLGLANSSDYNNGDTLIIKDMRFADNLAQGIGSTNGISISQDP